jgi:hypothetical protein
MEFRAAFSLCAKGVRAIAIVVLATVLMQAGRAWAQADESAATKVVRGTLTYVPHSLSFERVHNGTTSTKPVVLTNKSKVAITITAITPKGVGFSASQNCIGVLQALNGSCTMSVTYAPTSTNPKSVAVSGSVAITDNATGSPQKVTLTGSRFGALTSGNGAIVGAGIFNFNTGAGVTSPEIVEYTVNPSTGATSQAGTVATGSGAGFVAFTQDGKHAYAVGGGDIWGYSVQSGTVLLTSLGKVAQNPMVNAAVPYGSSILWALNENNTLGTLTVSQYPIKSGGTLGTPTTVSLSGGTLLPYTPPGATLPTAVWAFSPINFSSPESLLTLNVYPVNAGLIGSTALQTIQVPASPIQATTGAYLYGIGGTTQTLYTFSLASNGTLTPQSQLVLPTPAAGFWEIPLSSTVPAIGGTIDVFDFTGTEATPGTLNVYPISANGTVGSLLQSSPFSDEVQFLSSKSMTSSGVSVTQLPTMLAYVVQSTSIDEFPINSDGTIGSMSGSVTIGKDAGMLIPGGPPFSFAEDTQGFIYPYDVSSTGTLTALTSFAGPPVVTGFSAENLGLFPPQPYSSTPVALFVDTVTVSGSTESAVLTVYPLGSGGEPTNTSPSPIQLSSIIVQTYVLLGNGQIVPSAFAP